MPKSGAVRGAAGWRGPLPGLRLKATRGGGRDFRTRLELASRGSPPAPLPEGRTGKGLIPGRWPRPGSLWSGAHRKLHGEVEKEEKRAHTQGVPPRPPAKRVVALVAWQALARKWGSGRCPTVLPSLIQTSIY